MEQDQQIFTQHVQHNNTIHVVPWTICGRNSVCVAIKKSLCSFLVCASRKKEKTEKHVYQAGGVKRGQKQKCVMTEMI